MAFLPLDDAVHQLLGGEKPLVGGERLGVHRAVAGTSIYTLDIKVFISNKLFRVIHRRKGLKPGALHGMGNLSMGQLGGFNRC